MMAYRINASKKRRWPKLVFFLSLAAAFLVVGGLWGVKNLYEHNLRAVNLNANEDIVFVIENGDSVAVVADSLKQKSLIRSTQAFTQYVRSNDLSEAFKAGTYSLRQSYNVPTIVSYFVEGKVDTNLFTILPGRSLNQLRQDFIDKGGFTSVHVDAALMPDQYNGHPALVDKPAGASLEGFLYPDSYERVAETEPQTIIRQALDEMAEALAPDIRAGIAAQGLSVFQGITLASIIEGEVSSSEDRVKVAQVFLKRLRSNMPLESNATDLAKVELGPQYDTYNIPALPPGPVTNVSISSLRAVTTPAAGEFLYFVSGRDCVTRFSNTIGQHEELIARHGLSTDAGVDCRN